MNQQATAHRNPPSRNPAVDLSRGNPPRRPRYSSSSTIAVPNPQTRLSGHHHTPAVSVSAPQPFHPQSHPQHFDHTTYSRPGTPVSTPMFNPASTYGYGYGYLTDNAPLAQYPAHGSNDDQCQHPYQYQFQPQQQDSYQHPMELYGAPYPGYDEYAYAQMEMEMGMDVPYQGHVEGQYEEWAYPQVYGYFHGM
jgi:hypothetical protein